MAFAFLAAPGPNRARRHFQGPNAMSERLQAKVQDLNRELGPSEGGPNPTENQISQVFFLVGPTASGNSLISISVYVDRSGEAPYGSHT